MSERFPWHDEQWRRLQLLRARARVPHALLLRGPGGVGKRGFARRLARALLCRSLSEEGACGACRPCRLSFAETHPDLHVIESEEDRKLIGIDRIRAVNERVALTASGGARKAVVIAPAEAMSPPAANTLLKTLEEPPGDTVFILVSDRSSLLPATIRSRCQVLSFPCPPAPVALAWLKGRIDEGRPASEVLALARGAPLRALELARQSDPRAALLHDVESLLEADADPVAVAEGWVEHGIDAVSWWLTGIAQDALRARLAPALPAPAEAVHSLARKAPPAHWFRLFDCCLAARNALARQINLNERLALESLALACLGRECDHASPSRRPRPTR